MIGRTRAAAGSSGAAGRGRHPPARRWSPFLLAAFLALAAGEAWGQARTGNLFGTVTDTQGSALPGFRSG